MHVHISVAIVSTQTYMYLVIWVHITVYLSTDSPLTTRIAAKQSRERDSPVVAILDQTNDRQVMDALYTSYRSSWFSYTVHIR